MAEDVKIAEGVFHFTVELESEDVGLFEGLWPVPHGVTINSYLVQGDKTAIIDLNTKGEEVSELMESLIKEAGLPFGKIDYIILNHMEPDHTAYLPAFMKANPGAQILCTEKAAVMVRSFYHEDNIKTVKTGDTLDLGKGKILHFAEIPNLHWPETMATYEAQSQVLFSCDAFGSYGFVEDKCYADQLSPGEKKFMLDETLRYYSNIVSSFSDFVIKAVDKIKATGWPLKVIAPSHGPIWRQNPGEIVDYYVKMASYMNGPAEKEITLIWASMYGNTEKMVQSVISGVLSENLGINIFQIPQDHVSFILPAAFKSKALILGMPTYEYKMFPPMANVIDMFGRKHLYHKKVLRFGSFGWSGGAQRELDELAEKWKLKWSFVPGLEWKGDPTEEDLKRGYEAGKALAQWVKMDTEFPAGAAD